MFVDIPVHVPMSIYDMTHLRIKEISVEINKQTKYWSCGVMGMTMFKLFIDSHILFLLNIYSSTPHTVNGIPKYNARNKRTINKNMVKRLI